MVAGNENVLRINIRAVVAGIKECGSGGTEVDLGCASGAKKSDYTLAGSASYYGVVDENYTLAAYCIGYGIKLDSDLVLSDVLTGSDEGSAYILIFDKTETVRDTGLLGIADSGIKTRVGNSDYDVGIYLMSLGEKRTGSAACLVD